MFQHNTVISNAQARVWQSVPETFPSLPNTCFFANAGIQRDNSHREKFAAKAPGHVNGGSAPPTLSAHTREPLPPILKKATD